MQVSIVAPALLGLPPVEQITPGETPIAGKDVGDIEDPFREVERPVEAEAAGTAGAGALQGLQGGDFEPARKAAQPVRRALPPVPLRLAR